MERHGKLEKKHLRCLKNIKKYEEKYTHISYVNKCKNVHDTKFRENFTLSFTPQKMKLS